MRLRAGGGRSLPRLAVRRLVPVLLDPVAAVVLGQIERPERWVLGEEGGEQIADQAPQPGGEARGG